MSHAEMEVSCGKKLIIVTFINIKTQWGYGFKYPQNVLKNLTCQKQNVKLKHILFKNDNILLC